MFAVDIDQHSGVGKVHGVAFEGGDGEEEGGVEEGAILRIEGEAGSAMGEADGLESIGFNQAVIVDIAGHGAVEFALA